jgi:hypothetical protein
VAPFAPVALALLLSRAVVPDGQPVTSTTEVVAVKCDPDDFEHTLDCHSRFPTGCSKGGRYDPHLNLLKNQLTPPPTAGDRIRFLSEADFQRMDANLPADMDDHARQNEEFRQRLGRLGEGNTAGMIGYLYYVTKTGAESSNCQMPSTGDSEGTNVDFHLGIGFDAALADRVLNKKLTAADRKALKQTSIVVEMTPHYRQMFAEGEWTLDALRASVGKQVRVVGQLLVDSEHNVPHQNCAIATKSEDKEVCWRGSAWELHPVTQFLVCGKTTGVCEPNSTDWAQLTAGN